MSQRANLTVDQGTSVVYVLNVTDDLGNVIDITDTDAWVANAQIRKSYNSIGFTAFSIYKDLANNNIMALSANQTSNIAPGRYVWDLYLKEVITEYEYRIVEGIINITPQVTR